jgi:hypothetical protein
MAHLRANPPVCQMFFLPEQSTIEHHEAIVSGWYHHLVIHCRWYQFPPFAVALEYHNSYYELHRIVGYTKYPPNAPGFKRRLGRC